MPRMFANEFVYSSTSDDRYNEFMANASSPPLPQYVAQGQHGQQHQHHNQLPSSALTSSTSMHEARNSKSRSRSPPQPHVQASNQSSDEAQNASPEIQQHIHTISSNDSLEEEQQQSFDEYQATKAGPVASVSSNDAEDFEGFEDDVTPSQYKRNILDHKRFHLKRQYNKDCLEDSEGAVEAIEVEDDDEVVERIDDQIILRPGMDKTPIRKQNNAVCYPHTPNKRKKQQRERGGIATTPPHIKTPPDQIFEINSDSTTISQKQKRKLINEKFEPYFILNEHYKNLDNVAAAAAPNKCSTESTSEFPVSSPSNPQQPRGSGKYPPRPPLLKNTLPGDSFERQLAMITAYNPQMTLMEKIDGWRCDDECSDVEDVSLFDQEFKRFEKHRKSEMAKQTNSKAIVNEKKYDFDTFKWMLVYNMNVPQKNNKRHGAAGAGGSAGGFSSMGAQKVHEETSETSSDSCESVKHIDERPSTSATAQQQLQQRRCKPPTTNMESSDVKKRFVKETNTKRNQNSTSPPATSSSENEQRYFFQNSKKMPGPHRRFPPTGGGGREIQIHEKLLCPSSSEEANSQDVPTPMQLKVNPPNNLRQKAIATRDSKNLSCLANTKENDSGFRLHRLNREIDKKSSSSMVEHKEPKPISRDKLIDEIDKSIDLEQQISSSTQQIGVNKQQRELFKTPTVPPKYIHNSTLGETTINKTTTPSAAPKGATSTTSLESQTKTSAAVAETTNIPEATSSMVDVKLENEDNDYDGVYHQQHEFCNYLGLTGMSTATAMANAVAELAQCNLTRRSMRVLRQQQQERKEKSAKEEREMWALKEKQLNELKKHNRGPRLGSSTTTTTTTMTDNNEQRRREERTNSEPIYSILAPKEKKKKISNTSQNSSKAVVKTEQPQIKILCHIAASPPADHKGGEDEVDSILNKECIREVTPPPTPPPVMPLRESLMRGAKRQQQKHNKEGKEIKSEFKTDCYLASDEERKDSLPQLESSSPSISESRKKTLKSPRLTSHKSTIKVAGQSTNLQVNDENKEQPTAAAATTTKLLKEQTQLQSPSRQMTTLHTPTVYKTEILCDSPATITSRKSHFKSSLSVSNEIANNKEQQIDSSMEIKDISGGDENLQVNDRALTPTSAVIKEKLQAALEESRKTKPSIFIVQTLESTTETNKTPTKTVSLNGGFLDKAKLETRTTATINIQTTPTSTRQKKLVENLNLLDKKRFANITSRMAKVMGKKNGTKNLLRTRHKKHALSCSLRSAPKRELRARKIFLIKTSSPVSKKEGQLKQTTKTSKELEAVPSKPNKITKSTKPKEISNKPISVGESKPPEVVNNNNNNNKSYRNAQTETCDFEVYNIRRRTRLMAKASALLQRSKRRMSLAGGPVLNFRSKMLQKSNVGLNTMQKTQKRQPKIWMKRVNVEVQTKTLSASSTPPQPQLLQAHTPKKYDQQNDVVVFNNIQVKQNSPSPCCNLQESDNVVVSSTTNCYDERPTQSRIPSSPITLRSAHSTASCMVVSTPPETKDNWTQSDAPTIDNGAIRFLNPISSTLHMMRNPLNSDHGLVQYIYYEVDTLIVVQERLISFWKSSSLLNTLWAQAALNVGSTQQQSQKALNSLQSKTNNTMSHMMQDQIQVPLVRNNFKSKVFSSAAVYGEWLPLGELKRLPYDEEVQAPYANRICLHNSTPIYVEMRARQLPKNHRECNLLSMYINIYYFHDEDMIAKTNSIPLDTIQSELHSVNYTTLVDSRYFIMTWPQENLLGKTRSGLCKYSLTPQLDTLASIREFKSMRHTIRYLECMSDDKLIGFGDSQVTVWDHHSGDVIMNYDLGIPLGKNLGSVYYPRQEMDQNNMIILFQCRDFKTDVVDEPPELLTLACTIDHTQTSYRILRQQLLPASFKIIKRAINTGEHLVITNANDEEIWISCNNPALMVYMPKQQQGRLQQHQEQLLQQQQERFYSRSKPHLVELTGQTLNFDTLANYVLKLAAVIKCPCV
uniref:Uncharacterized protein n=1 Tax=Stomoxys calcitrans TaxID=35570 RepID=A0A1I8P4R6_STOCA